MYLLNFFRAYNSVAKIKKKLFLDYLPRNLQALRTFETSVFTRRQGVTTQETRLFKILLLFPYLWLLN
jgi:hypothetical protein